MCRNEETEKDITSIVDHILQNHSGAAVKSVKFQNDFKFQGDSFMIIKTSVILISTVGYRILLNQGLKN